MAIKVWRIYYDYDPTILFILIVSYVRNIYGIYITEIIYTEIKRKK